MGGLGRRQVVSQGGRRGSRGGGVRLNGEVGGGGEGRCWVVDGGGPIEGYLRLADKQEDVELAVPGQRMGGWAPEAGVGKGATAAATEAGTCHPLRPCRT